MSEKKVIKDTTIKIFAIISAIVLWYYVMTEQNPVSVREFSVPIKIINREYLEKNDMVLMDDADSYQLIVKVRAKKNVLDNISENTLRAIADINGHKATGENDLNIIVSGVPEDVIWYQKSTESIKVFLEPKVSVQKSVTVSLTGSPKMDLAAMTPICEPAQVVITGAMSQVNKVKTAKVDVDISGADIDILKKLPIVLVDDAGNTVDRVSIDVTTASVQIPISNTKRVPIQYDLIGKPADGYTLNNVSGIPKDILITGKPEILDTIDVITTENIDITGITTSIEKDIMINLPESVELVSKDEKIRITVDVEKIVTQSIYIDNIQIRNLDSEFTYEGLNTGAQVLVKGAESLVRQAGNTIELYVDMKNRKEGSNTLDIMCEKNSNIEILEITPQQINIEIKRAQ